MAYERHKQRFLGKVRLPEEPPEHKEPELFAAISRHKSGVASPDDLRFIALRFLTHVNRNESLRYLRLYVDAGGEADSELIVSANKLGIDATDPAPCAP